MSYYEKNIKKKFKDPTDYTYGRFLGNPYIKKARFETKWTEDLLKEWLYCKEDIEYFAKKYVQIINLDLGKINIDPYPYQIKMWKSFSNHRFNIVLAARQSGKSIGYVVWILHKLIFTPDYKIAIAANKGTTARQILSRVSLALKNLPFFLQPGCEEFNKGSITFDTNSNVFAAATSSDSIRGDSVNCVILDEFAFVDNDTVFMTSTYPVISSGKSTKIIIVSTPNGIGNEYQKIWVRAINKRNEYHPIRVDWFDVPGRDEAWKALTIKNTSQRQFDQEFGLKFYGSSNTLIDGDVLSRLSHDNPIREKNGFRMYDKPHPQHKYIMTVDVAKGRGIDRSTLTVFDVSSIPFKQVFVYQDALISPLVLPDILMKWGNIYNNALIIVESNDQGTMVASALHYDLEYENMFLSSYKTSDGIGIEVNKKIKAIGCSNMKDLIEENKLLIVDKNAISEMTTFISKGRSYEAKVGKHDDLVANIWLFGWFTATEFFEEYFNFAEDESLADVLFRDKRKEMEEVPLYFGKETGMEDIDVLDLPMM